MVKFSQVRRGKFARSSRGLREGNWELTVNREICVEEGKSEGQKARIIYLFRGSLREAKCSSTRRHIARGDNGEGVGGSIDNKDNSDDCENKDNGKARAETKALTEKDSHATREQ